MREQDLLCRLELFPNENPDSEVDCTLKLGPPLPDQIDSKTDKTPNSASPQVMQKHGMANGLGISLSNQFTCFPDIANRNYSRDGSTFFFGGSSSMAAPANSNVLNEFGGYLGFTLWPQNNVKVNSVSQRRTEPEPSQSIRRCASCDTISTPLWRNGPMGAKTLCNACGIRYRKEERTALGIPVKRKESTNKFRV